MTKALVLSLPDLNKQFVIQNDASGIGLGLVLTQDGHPLTFLAKRFVLNNKFLQLMFVNCMQLPRLLKMASLFTGKAIYY